MQPATGHKNLKQTFWKTNNDRQNCTVHQNPHNQPLSRLHDQPVLSLCCARLMLSASNWAQSVAIYGNLQACKWRSLQILHKL